VRFAVLVASAGLVSCSYLPAQQERARAESILSNIKNVVLADVECGSSVFAGDEFCASVVMKDGAKIHFSHLGFHSFGAAAAFVVVDEAGGLVPRVASCGGISPPNFHRDGPLGHHFRPALLDVRDAVGRHREVLTEVQWWPQCPQSWEVEDRAGARYRYCARKPDAKEEPPKPANCEP
jgi:hypothetical protein